MDANLYTSGVSNERGDQTNRKCQHDNRIFSDVLVTFCIWIILMNHFWRNMFSNYRDCLPLESRSVSLSPLIYTLYT